MNNKKLRVIAKGMGYYIATTFDFNPDSDAVYIGDCSNTYLESLCFMYRPETDNDQMVEIIEKLHLNIDWLNGSGMWRVNVPNHKFKYGKTLNEAVCLAAYNYFKGQNYE